MISFTNTIYIARPTPQVYDYLVDLEHLPDWNWAISETTKVTQGPVAVGSRFVLTRTAPRHEHESLQLTSLTPHRRIEIEGMLAGLDANVIYDLDDDGAGTRLTNTVALDSPHLSPLASRLLELRIRRSVAGNLRDLQSLLTGVSATGLAGDVGARIDRVVPQRAE